jgi:tetratricopeptide (TPR) repeat protein
MWFRAAGQTIVALGGQGKAQEIGALVAKVRAVEPQLEARDAFLACLSEGASHLIAAGLLAAADALLEEAARLAGYFADIEPQAWAQVHEARAARAAARGESTAVLGELEKAGDMRSACAARSGIGAVYADLGDASRAVEILREVVTGADKLGLPEVAAVGRRDLSRVLGWRGESLEAERLARQAIATLGAWGQSRAEGVAVAYLAEIMLSIGRFDEAATLAERSATMLGRAPAERALALALLARARLGRGRVHDASVVAHEAYYGALGALEAMGECETVVRLAYAECLLAGQDIEAARQVLLRARQRLHLRATNLGPRADREAFCKGVPHNAAILRLADEHLGPVRGAVSEEKAARSSKRS